MGLETLQRMKVTLEYSKEQIYVAEHMTFVQLRFILSRRSITFSIQGHTEVADILNSHVFSAASLLLSRAHIIHFMLRTKTTTRMKEFKFPSYFSKLELLNLKAIFEFI